MRCPACRHEDTRVIDSRTPEDFLVRRRRECQECGERFTTYERIEHPPVTVVKKGGDKEPFDPDKVMRGIRLACQKRPVTPEQMEGAVLRVEQALERVGREVPSSAVGEAVMDVLRDIDDVAYVRFASVYRAFDSAEEFVDIIRPLRER